MCVCVCVCVCVYTETDKQIRERDINRLPFFHLNDYIFICTCVNTLVSPHIPIDSFLI